MSGWTCPLGLPPWAKATAANSQLSISKRTVEGTEGGHRRLSLLRDQGGPPHAGLSSSTNLSRASARGTKGSIPSNSTVDQKHVRKADGVSRILGTLRHLSSEHYPPLASPFLGPNPVFEIKPQGLGLRGEPVPPAGFGASPNAPGDVRPSLGLRVPVSAGDGPSPPSRSQNRCPAKMHTPSPPLSRHAHGLDRRLPGRGWNLWCRPRR